MTAPIAPALLLVLRARGERTPTSTQAEGTGSLAALSAASFREAVDPATGRYTEAFLRFLSARYAPVGAGNDPMGLNRFHAENLVALYPKASGGG